MAPAQTLTCVHGPEASPPVNVVAGTVMTPPVEVDATVLSAAVVSAVAPELADWSALPVRAPTAAT